jgi:hypothetical protein
MDNGTRQPEFFALLIGIDFYFEYVLAEGIRYPKLGGCVRDILHVKTFLTTSLRLPETNIIALTATVEIGEDKPIEPEGQWPTYENMVAAFKQLTARAAPGDQIYVHYSGHGGRASTVLSELKGADGLDETLVPLDIGKPGTRYLRDVEIHKLIRDMVDKGLVVTVVFDCCHSGGATRAAATAGLPGAVVRGVAAIDTTRRPRESDVASPEALAAAWGAGDGRATRAAKAIKNWQLEAEGYTLLAACRPNELAAEWPFDGRERNGALTYWLLDTLRQAPAEMTYQMLADRVVAKVHSQFATQTPMLQGNADLRIFGSRRTATRFATTVLKVDPAKGRVRLNAGEAHGLGAGAQLAVFPNGTADFDRTENRLALVEVTELEPVECWATVTEQKPGAAIDAGAQAVLTAAAPAQVRLRRGVLIAVQDAGLRARLEAAVGSEGKGFVALAGADVPVDFQVDVNPAGELVIEDAADRPVPNLRPAIRADASDAAARIVARLVHLAKYRNVQGLDMPDPATRAKLKVELTTDRPAAGGAAPVLRPGDTATLKITNTQAPNPANPDDPERVLNISVLDLMSNWSIAQIYPETGAFEPLDPGRTLSIDLEASLDEGTQASTDILKVFATQATTSFQWLQLPALDQPAARGAKRGAIADPLEAVLASVTAEQATTRAVKLARTGGNRGWTTAQVEMRVEAAGAPAPDGSGAPDGGRGATMASVPTPGAAAAGAARATASTSTIRVEVTHGDLRVATFPLFVGHYQGDGIVSAEREIDRQLCGRLTARRNLGLYPGALNSAHAFAPAPISRNGPRPFPGAVVVGLGNVGHLTPGDLAGTVLRGLLELVSATAEGKITTALRPDGSIGISTLVIGGGEGGIGHRESIHAMLRAVNDANDIIAQRPARSAPLPAIREVEFIELYEDRAHSTFHVLGALREDERLDIAPEIKGADGALRRVRFDEAPHWWRRIEIIADKDKLHFKVLTDAARSEGYLSTTQLALVRRLIDDATTGTATAPGLSRTLFQLLVPNGLKGAAPQEGSLMLMLNEEAAGYPWELLENCQRSEPLIRRVRVLRQLVLGPGTFDATGRAISSEDVALVIGDTDTRGLEAQFSELPGAQAEATAVAVLLRESGFKAEPRIRPRPSDTLQLILTGSFRILHIAAHGVFELRQGPDGEAVTGMVLGGGLYLTAQEINQMTSVPELVFLNCCYLGREKRETKFHLIAANLASQFMRNGVRCVIASGWEVDDQAAQFFAEEFYTSMGAAQNFGDAVHSARRRTLERFPNVNTWGAFQCYGDPNYVLKARSDESAAVATALHFGSVEELCLQLDAVRDDVSTAESMARLTALAGQIKQLRAQAPARWLEKYARLGEAFGRAFAAVEDCESAIASYRTGMAAARADATLAMHEQLMNVCARHAARKAIWHRDDASFDAEAARIEIRDLIRQIEAWSAAYPTAERLSILGSAWKRLAMVEASRGDLLRMRGHLKQSVKRYVQAAERAVADKAYPLSQVALGRLLGGWTSSAIRADAVASMDAIAALQSAMAAPSTFWDSVYVADLAFLRTLHGIAAGTQKAQVEEVADPYSVAIHRGASALEKQSPAETFDSVIVALEAYPMRTSDGAPTRAAQGAALVRDLCALLGFAAPPPRAARVPPSPRLETSSRPAGDDHPVGARAPPAE